jgi:hypothetical protein
MYSFRLDPSLMRKVKAIAERETRTVADQVRLALKEHVEDRETAKKKGGR